MKHYLFFLTFCLWELIACKPNYPGSMDDPNAKKQQWTLTSVDTTLTLPNGFYDLVVYAKGTLGQTLTIQAGERLSGLILKDNQWSPLLVRGVEVTNGILTIQSIKQTQTQYQVTGISLTPSSPFTFLKGGDLSMLTRVEKAGGQYFTADGQPTDGYSLMAANGMNIVRLRLYNDPGNRKFNPSKKMYSGVADEKDILASALRAKQAGMRIELTFHYSDYWTNGSEQHKPHEWVDYSQTQLDSALYAYTHAFLGKMVAQGTAPDYVSLGNEIQSGILFGSVDANTGLPTDSINGFCDDMPKLAHMLNQAAKAVREVCPQAKIILHLTSGDAIGIDNYKWFFNAMENNQVDYDIIGSSYYPYYGGITIETICDWADKLGQLYNKDIIFMEVGFAWTKSLADGSEGQISNNGPYAISKEAQREFLFNLMYQIKSMPSARCLGLLYWDPIYYDVGGKTGYINGGKNVTGNSTLVDFEGVALPALDAFKYNN